MLEESALEYKNMELEEERSQWWRDTSVRDIKSTRSRCWRSNVCSIICVTLPLFLILIIMVSLKSNQQDNMLKELETKADNMASALHSLQSNLQQTAPHSQQPEELTEVKSAVTNLGASITSLSSKLQVSQHDLRLKGLEMTMNNMSSSLNTILSRLQQTVKEKDVRLQELETVVNNVSSFLDTIPSTLQQTVEKEGRRMTVLEHSVTNLTVSTKALSSGLQDTASQQGTTMQELETAVRNMSSTLNSVASKMQETVGQQERRLMNLETKADNMASSLNSLSSKLEQTDEKLMTMLTNMTAEIMSIKRSKDKITYSCTENWKLHETSCYLFSSNTLPWHKAVDYCKTQSATLLIINNQDEWMFIIKRSVPTNYWIGLTDELTGQWRWVDGTPYVMDKSKWEVGQPDDWTKHGLGGGEDCAHIQWNAKLNDDHCTREHKYICERTATADST
ncbi:asialoglycoprotein receptor 1-like isoform X2 [Sardina pilchardus]|uniref:asialoglycoprotein receptor 1-like isoform X2 n=1 Tax=Sardina pilchardus TaxID=27697 RepID=UPI002E0E43FB